ncbi:hypothetical protein CPC197_0712, partial [Chlamydia psittaci C1/97]
NIYVVAEIIGEDLGETTLF